MRTGDCRDDEGREADEESGSLLNGSESGICCLEAEKKIKIQIFKMKGKIKYSKIYQHFLTQIFLVYMIGNMEFTYM